MDTAVSQVCRPNGTDDPEAKDPARQPARTMCGLPARVGFHAAFDAPPRGTARQRAGTRGRALNLAFHRCPDASVCKATVGLSRKKGGAARSAVSLAPASIQRGGLLLRVLRLPGLMFLAQGPEPGSFFSPGLCVGIDDVTRDRACAVQYRFARIPFGAVRCIYLIRVFQAVDPHRVLAQEFQGNMVRRKGCLPPLALPYARARLIADSRPSRPVSTSKVTA